MADAVRGYLCAVLAAVMYGLQYTPVKAFPVYDGSKFQWFMSAGIAFAGVVAGLTLSTERLEVIPYGILGGALWGTANVLVIPTVKFLGLGVGFAMYHAINMAVGYAIGRFGLLGAPVESAAHPAVRDGGLWLLLVSLAFMIFVEPEIEDVEEAEDAAARPSPARRETALLPPAKPPSLGGKRALSVDQLEELSINAGSREARRGYSDWRRGKAKGSVESSSGLVGVRSKLTKADIVRRMRDSPLLWPLYESGATVRSHYRSMLSGMLSGKAHPAPPTLLAACADPEAAREDRALLDPRRRKRPPLEDEAAGDHRHHNKSTKTRFALGAVFGLVAGLLCGTNMLPYVLYLEHNRATLDFNDTLSFCVSQCLGVFLAATVLLALCAAAARVAHIELKSPAVWPAWAAGTLWSVGFLLASVAVEDLGMAQAYTYDAIGPVMLSACISFFCGEIVGPANTILFLAALVLQAAGVLAIALGA